MGGCCMTRKEEIIEAGIDYTMSVRPMCVGGLAFEEEIRQMNRNKSFEEGAKWADKTMIDKACEWLEQHKENYDMYDAWSGDYVNFKSLIIDFRKAMEE